MYLLKNLHYVRKRLYIKSFYQKSSLYHSLFLSFLDQSAIQATAICYKKNLANRNMDFDTYIWLRNQFTESSKPCNHGNNDYEATIMQLLRCQKKYHKSVQLYCECLKCGNEKEYIHTFEILNNEKCDRGGYYYDCYNHGGPGMKDRYVS